MKGLGAPYSAHTTHMQSTGQLLPVLLLLVAVLVPFEGVMAKVKPHKQLIEEKGAFDTSLLPKSPLFKLRIKHTQILFPEDPAILLHGNGRLINLRADKSDIALRGRVAEDQRDSTVNTREYGVKPRFYVDLRKLAAKSAPELAWLMQSEIAAGRLKVAAEVARDEQLMQRELRSRQPQLGLPPIPAPSGPSPAPSNELEAALAQAKQHAQRESRQAIQHYEAAVSQGERPVERLPSSQVNLSNNVLLGVPDWFMPSAPKTNTSRSQRQMTEELAKANQLAPSESQVNVRLDRAQKQAQAAVRQAQPVMDTILTHLRPIANLRIPATVQIEAAPERDAQSVIQWDAWHAQFAKLAQNPILQVMGRSGNPSGVNTVEITVWPNHHIAVRLVKSGNAGFDQAILKAYHSLDGNPALEFPPHSRRSTVTFLIDNKHTGTGVPSAVKSETSIGDTEILHYHR